MNLKIAFYRWFSYDYQHIYLYWSNDLKLEILALKCFIKSGRVKCEKTYLKDYSTWCHTLTLCRIISYDFKIDDMIGIFINTDLNAQHCNKCYNVTVQDNILCKKCGQMNVLIRNKNVLYPYL